MNTGLSSHAHVSPILSNNLNQIYFPNSPVNK